MDDQVNEIGESQEVIQRGAPDVAPARAALVSLWTKRVHTAKKHFESAFKQMKRDMFMARRGRDRAVPKDHYVANIIQRHINQRVASLYAKNPRATVRRKQRMDFKIWDGSLESLGVAQQILIKDQTNQAALDLVEDVINGRNRREMLDKVSKTLEIIFHHYINEQEPKFKTQAKQMVRRTLITGIGYIKIGFERALEKRPEITAKIEDAAARLSEIERLSADIADGVVDENGAEAETLRIMIGELQKQESLIVREGLFFDFPKSRSIIPDVMTRQLKGWVGTRWIATEMTMTPEAVKRVYKIDVGKNFTQHRPDDPDKARALDDGSKPLIMLWEIQDRDSRTVFTVADGYPDFIKEPTSPNVELEQFFDLFAITFNDIEDENDEEGEDEIFPLSDVSLLAPMQNEYNRSRQGLREHRARNRPGWVVALGALEDVDKTALQSNVLNALIEIRAMAQGQKISDMIQPKPTAPIDPNLYEVNSVFEDILRVAGSQEANLGGVAGGTATESSIAESSRLTSVQSNVDDMDDFLTEIARASGQILLAQLSVETAKKIAGEGAVWPEFSGQEIAEEIVLEIKAGSSGRPNKAAELANLERAAPTLLQIPGVNPRWFAEQVIKRLDDADINLEDAILEGLPSMVAQNALAGRQAQPGAGDPQQDPGAQGDRGVSNGARPDGADQTGSQPAFPGGADSLALPV